MNIQERHKKFISGLDNLNLTLKELQLNYKYAGGDRGGHNKYFKLCFKKEQRPEHKDKCICNQPIKNNCYITNEYRFFSLRQLLY